VTGALAAASGLDAGDAFSAVVAGVGVALLVGVAALSHEERQGLSAPVVYLATGIAGSVFLGLVGVPRLDPIDDALVIERVTEFALVIALFATGLRIHPRLEWQRWRAVAVLLVVGLPLTVLAAAALGAAMLGLPVGVAIILAAALAPTDPVLAGDIGVAPPDEEETADRGLTHGRFALTGEAGLNDGLVYPLFLLGVLVITRDGAGWLANWAVTDVAYGVAIAVAVGAAAGYGLAAALLPLHERGLLASGAEHFLAAAAAVGVYGAVQVVDAYGFVAVFTAGVAFRRYEQDHDYNRQLHDGASLLMRFGELVVVLLLGSMVTLDGLAAPGVDGWLLALTVILLVRPLVGFLCLAGSDLPRGERVLVSWFGVRGVATLYYAAIAVTGGALGGGDEQTVVWTAVCTVALSVVIHSVTAIPISRRPGAAREA
jgi:NhaP-type Na+/H+ or K+/H+ antiporter